MIITRTPFRFTLGGGGTDLPSYYSKYGGFIFAAAINKYMFINLNRPVVDDLVCVKYTKSDTLAAGLDGATTAFYENTKNKWIMAAYRRQYPPA
ncbi:MAG: hypothetical protein Q7U03_00275 [Syntrophales bacterium]|nr:hypothetical protein [Syntrophales bacterium]